ncbi:hypothetical protein ILT44_27380 [Microvirga sp. BT689]|uniref:hypothetical protein n=1 Tax=Microvirga arvi TaxID=2778731 RepID=UPI00194F14CB|nr:hypothetical protein [Microvirga arvi]MBM6583929.1 hypothetical protein [Microvirga arvi]
MSTSPVPAARISEALALQHQTSNRADAISFQMGRPVLAPACPAPDPGARALILIPSANAAWQLEKAPVPTEPGSNVGDRGRTRIANSHGSPNSPTAKTRMAYSVRAQGLMKRYRDETLAKSKERPTLAGFTDWLITRKSEWGTATWRLYKASVVWELSAALACCERALAQGENTARAARRIVKLREALHRLRREGQAGAKTRTDRTSATKCKRFPQQARDTIQKALVTSGSGYASPLSDYLRAGVLAGLRPQEWPGVEFRPPPEGWALEMMVRNAKHDGARGNGAFRTLRWRSLGDEDHQALVRWVTHAKSAHRNGSYEVLLDGLARLLRDLCRGLWPKRKQHYTLYSCRHEFAAQVKAGYGDPATVAALMGHASDATASSHYGRPRRGGETATITLPEPDPQEIAMVRSRLGKNLTRMHAHRAQADGNAVAAELS